MTDVVNATQEEYSTDLGQAAHAASTVLSVRVSISFCLCTTDAVEERVTLGLTSHCHLLTVKVSMTSHDNG